MMYCRPPSDSDPGLSDKLPALRTKMEKIPSLPSNHPDLVSQRKRVPHRVEQYTEVHYASPEELQLLAYPPNHSAASRQLDTESKTSAPHVDPEVTHAKKDKGKGKARNVPNGLATTTKPPAEQQTMLHAEKLAEDLPTFRYVLLHPHAPHAVLIPGPANPSTAST